MPEVALSPPPTGGCAVLQDQRFGAREVNGVKFVVTVADEDGTVLDWFDVEYDGAVEGADKANARAAVLEAAGLINDGVF